MSEWRHIQDSDATARKDHRCLLCGQKIAKGTKYTRRTGFGEDGPVTMRMHTECEAETRDWDEMDWETFDGDFERPDSEEDR